MSILLPSWLDSAHSEKSAAAMVRALPGRNASWGELIASAQATMAFVEEEFDAMAPHAIYEEENAVPLMAAARILDSASQPYSELPDDDRYYLGLLAGAAFGMYANFPSAEAVLRRSLAEMSPESPGVAAAIATAAPNLTTEMLPQTPAGSEPRRYLEALNLFHYSGDVGQAPVVREALINCLLGAETPFEQTLLGSCRIALEHTFELSVVRALGEFGAALPRDYPQKLVDRGIRVLLPPQFKALSLKRLVEANDNAIVALPTGTGKTLLGEIALLSALGDKPGIACYLTPYVALGRQVAQSIERHAPPSVRVHRMIGGYREAEKLFPEERQELIVATPERMDGLLRTSPELVRSFRCVVVDEAHGIQYGARGVRLEGLLTRLRLIQQQSNIFRLVLLSAVLSEYSNLARWLGISSESVVTDSCRRSSKFP